MGVREQLGQGQPAGIRVALAKSLAPYQLSREQFLSQHSPAPLGDHAHHPADVPQLRAELPSLADYANDEQGLRDWLGHGQNPRHDVSHLTRKVQRGDAISVYRASDREHDITPGASVTPSRRYAEDHARAQGLSGGRILERKAYPHELIPTAHNEMVYAPRDLGRFHEEAVMDAVKGGKPVPPHVLAGYPHLAGG